MQLFDVDTEAHASGCNVVLQRKLGDPIIAAVLRTKGYRRRVREIVEALGERVTHFGVFSVRRCTTNGGSTSKPG
jgi:hypothetical protein